MEQSQTAGESSARQRDEVQREMERLRLAQRDAERTLAARERAHRQRTKGLEEQVTRPPTRPQDPVLLSYSWVTQGEMVCLHRTQSRRNSLKPIYSWLGLVNVPV